MDIATSLFVVALLYCMLMFFDTFFKTCAHYPYIQFLQGTGLRVKFFQLHWTTTAFNRLFVRWGCSYTRFWNLWFKLGLYTTLLLLPVAIIVLIISTVQTLFMSRNDGNGHGTLIEPLIIGVNLPASEIGYYSLTLIFCSVIHELGHTLASVNEDVHIINVGVTLFFVFPVAYVNISSDKLSSLSAWKSLSILCAGIWHNVVLVFFAYLLYLISPYIFAPFFYSSSGVAVMHIGKNVLLEGPRGFSVGDTIIKINNCVVYDDISWSSCLQQVQTNKPAFCTSADLAHLLDESVQLVHRSDGTLDCCGDGKPRSLCFEYIDSGDGVLQLPMHMCLPARKIIENSVYFCNSDTKQCPVDLHCIQPLFQNTTTLFKIKRIEKSDVIYIGHFADLLQAVHVSAFVPKTFFTSTVVPDTIIKFLSYVIVFSAGLAVVNVVPCIFMDGQHITNSLMQVILVNKASKQTISFVSLLATLLGTVLLVFHCVHTLWVKLLS